MNFDFAIEDSPAAFEHIMHFEGCKVAVYDLPWNKQSEFLNDQFVRCESWKALECLVEACAGKKKLNSY